jgi:single-stranded-DNA-specific exonuclease
MIRHGQITEGLKALIQLTRRPLRSVNSQAVAFFIAPRINAVGRMEDMTAGIQLLLTDSPYHARLLADRIESINNERKDLQATMLDQAEDIVSRFNKIEQVGVVVYDPTWHAGIVGLVASRLKESLYRPVIAFAPAEQGSTELRGSGRSIPGFHLRDALALINTQHPGMIAKFGGHNGIKSLNAHIGDDTARIRVGIYQDLRDRIDDADFVLQKFTAKELLAISAQFDTIEAIVGSFIAGDFASTTHRAS